MNYLIIKKHVTMATIAVLFISCNGVKTSLKNTSQLNIVASNSYEEFRNTYADAGILLQRIASFNSTSSSAEMFSVAIVNDDMLLPGYIALNGHILSDSNHYTIQNFDEALSTNLYGNEIQISYDGDILADSLYNAVPIFVSFDLAQNPNYTLTEGLSFTWNPDIHSQGVIFNVSQEDIDSAGLPTINEKEIILADNGSFTIPQGWLDEFADGSLIHVRFFRGNYGMLTTANNLRVGFIGMSSCEGNFIKKD